MQQAEDRTIAPPPVYYYRRRVPLREALPAVGAAIGAGLAAFYLARLLLQRTPLEPSNRLPEASRAVERPRVRRVRPAG